MLRELATGWFCWLSYGAYRSVNVDDVDGISKQRLSSCGLTPTFFGT